MVMAMIHKFQENGDLPKADDKSNRITLSIFPELNNSIKIFILFCVYATKGIDATAVRIVIINLFLFIGIYFYQVFFIF